MGMDITGGIYGTGTDARVLVTFEYLLLASSRLSFKDALVKTTGMIPPSKSLVSSSGDKQVLKIMFIATYMFLMPSPLKENSSMLWEEVARESYQVEESER